VKKFSFAFGVLVLAVLWLVTPQTSWAAPSAPANLTLERYSFFATQPPAAVTAPGGSVALNALAAPTQQTFPSCRYGTAIAAGPWLERLPQLNALSMVGAGWYVDFWSDPPTTTVAAQFTPIVYIKQNKNGCTYLPGYYTYPALTEDQLGAKVLAQPGVLWLIGNEPDRGPDPGKCQSNQDDTHAEVYAQAYHDVRQFILAHDPTARTANAGLVEFTPGRQQYLDMVWQAYQRLFGVQWPVDVWNMHLYVLPEATTTGAPNGVANIALGTDPSLAIRESGGNPALCGTAGVYCFAQHDSMAAFQAQVRGMRTWMQAHGQQQKPLILSEYSQILPYLTNPNDPNSCFKDENGNCFTSQRVTNFANATADYFETEASPTLGYATDGGRLVQQALWFAMNYPAAGVVSNLVTPSGSGVTLTQVGQAWVTHNQGEGVLMNLLPTSTFGAGGFVHTPGGTVTATLAVDILNNGNTTVNTPFTVRFSSDAAGLQPIASVQVSALTGCATKTIRVYAPWSGLSAGTHPYWVTVDSGASVSETNEADNVISGSVFVGSSGLYMPLTFRP
jgi:hypothetical protein